MTKYCQEEVCSLVASMAADDIVDDLLLSSKCLVATTCNGMHEKDLFLLLTMRLTSEEMLSTSIY